ncbi:MAG TPA: hypothetical protein DDZ88_00680 [Verrucomicrobiales bacterium]|nr:hypothetical protein [Verrucomicrobiales bacterium]
MRFFAANLISEADMKSALKEGLHPRNGFRTRYDFPQLVACSPVPTASGCVSATLRPFSQSAPTGDARVGDQREPCRFAPEPGR